MAMTIRSRLASGTIHRARGLDFLLLVVLFGIGGEPATGVMPSEDFEEGPVWLPPDAPQGAIADAERRAASFAIDAIDEIDLNDPRAVFAHVFSHLPADTDVLPTENYFYWRFHTGDKYVWGNLRLGPDSRDRDQVHIGYYEFSEDMTGPEEANARYTVLGPEHGIKTAKIDDLTYDIIFEGRSVRFRLNRISQASPESAVLAEDEVFVFNTHDESNTQFHLLFNTRTKNLMFVAKEDQCPLDQIELINNDLALDRGTGFLYYIDAAHNNRKVLFGVYRRNIAQNNYYDGPADQLADNQIPNVPEYRSYLNAAYPFTRGIIDQYGFFTDDPGNRIAVAPYYSYNSIDEMESMLATCQSYSEEIGEVMACMLPGGYEAGRESDPAQFINNSEPLTPIAGLNFLPGMLAAAGLAGGGGVPVANSFDVFVEDWENGLNGWTTSGLWHLVQEPPTSCPPALNYTSPVTSAYYGIDPQCNYDGGNTFGYLTSPNSPPLPEDSFLEFWSRRKTEAACGIYDITEVQISVAGGPWQLLQQVCDESNQWVKSGPISLQNYMGQSVRIRFSFQTVDAANNANLGWMVDDIRLVSGPAVGDIFSLKPRNIIHAAGVTWHIPGVTFIPPGTKHNSGVTWHMAGQTFIPPGSIHNSGVTWHYAGQTFIPEGTIHNSGVTWHYAGQTFIPKGTKHNSGFTWHYTGQSFIPPGTKHNSGVTWHVPGATFIPPGSKHNSGVTWHVAGVTFIPPGTKHNSGVTWHVPGITFIPPGSKHNSGVTWHVAGITFIPPGTKHNSGVTWHVAGETFIPPGAKHNSGVTWHVAGVSFIPAGTKHNSGVTWHVAGATFIPAGAKHNSGVTWHVAGQTFIPAGAKHNSGVTWHYAGQSFIPAGTIHNSGVTWHYAGQSFIPAGTKHNSGSTWHYTGQSFIPPGTIHNSGVTWHYAGQTFIPAGTKHNSGVTWHFAGVSFIPKGAKHNSGVTWHVAGVTFIPANAKHMAGATWHQAGATFLFFHMLPWSPGPAPPVPHNSGVTWVHTTQLSELDEIPPQCNNNGDCESFGCYQAVCSGVDGNCEYYPMPGMPCDDGDPNTEGDTCDNYGSCIGSPNAGQPCDDGSPCTLNDMINPSGVCERSPAPLGMGCHSGNHCIAPGTGQCDGAGHCVGGTVMTGAPCDDGDAFTQNDTCDSDGGCYGQNTIPCGGINNCAADTQCDPVSGQINTTPEACDDTCAGENGTCSTATGCQEDSAPICDLPDDNLEGDCINSAGGCVSAPVECDDGNSCTQDMVDPQGNCVPVPYPDGTVCDDGNACTSNESCQAATCVPADVTTCPDCSVCDSETGLCSDPTPCPQDVSILQWRSVRTHTGPGELPFELNAAATGNGNSGPTAETRGIGTDAGVRKVQVDFSGPITLANPANVTVTYRVTTPGTPATMGGPIATTPTSVALADADTLNILFGPGQIPNMTCIEIVIGAGTLAETISGDADCMIRSLQADSNSNGTVTLADALLTKANTGAAVPPNQRFDYNLSGTLTLADTLACKAQVVSPSKTALCP